MLNNELYHYEAIGMKLGVRRYQNPDGTLTTRGKKKYAKKILNEHVDRTNRHLANSKISAAKKVKSGKGATKQEVLDEINLAVGKVQREIDKRYGANSLEIAHKHQKNMRQAKVFAMAAGGLTLASVMGRRH